MEIKYTINTYMMSDAVKMAQSMAMSHGFKSVRILNVVRTAHTEWVVTLWGQK